MLSAITAANGIDRSDREMGAEDPSAAFACDENVRTDIRPPLFLLLSFLLLLLLLLLRFFLSWSHFII